MSLVEKFKTASPTPSGLPCGMAKLMESMTEDERKALEYVLFEQIDSIGRRISNPKIHKILVDEGYNIAQHSVAQHRRKQCRCFVGATARTKGN